MKLAVVGGCGYVGLITSVGFALMGHQVYAVDIDESKVLSLSKGISPVHEDGLDEALSHSLREGNLTFTTDIESAAKGAEVVFVAVGSPSLFDGGTDMSQVKVAARLLAEALDQYSVIAIKSTVPAGTIEMVNQIIEEHSSQGLHADVVANPEFLREGQGLADFMFPNRIVVGTDSEKAREVMRTLYSDFIDVESKGNNILDIAHEVPYIETSIPAAQMIKYASNAYLATRISFINEIAGICEIVDADVKEVVKGLGYDKRIGWDYFQPGIGFGGPCLEKDIRGLIHFSAQRGYQPSFMRAVIDRNDFQIQQMVARVAQSLDGSIAGKSIAILGLAFKPGTNDVRTSLSIRIIQQLLDLGADLSAHDPIAIENARQIIPHLRYYENESDAASGADLVMVLTDWPQYSDLDWEAIGRVMKQKCMVDGRNLLDPRLMNQLGFRYSGVGYPILEKHEGSL
ncbi:MAG: UDP-glucose 6-dehydrogenase [Chloroflexi bacterium]|nr:UDP-glucose 6-dehydrogenase [Chloroflexota bacterium]